MPDRPHVLLISTDHWPAALLGCAGHPVIQTPTLDEMARCGTRFTNAYSECPVCIPARRSLMTGLNPRSHGDRTFQTTLPMPDVPTLADCFRDAGYQSYAVGKLHVFPQRARIGFDDVVLAEEGRPHWGVWDDYDVFLGEQGHAGKQFLHGMSNNQYSARPWHLAEETHVTNWSTREMSRMIRRRDPTRPGFWYLSYTHPHPPLVPTQVYWDLYRDVEPEWPHYGDWVPRHWHTDPDARLAATRRGTFEGTPQPPAKSPESLSSRIVQQHAQWHVRTPTEIRTALRAFYALCTQIDHQLRIVIGTLREEGLLSNTIIMFTADHGDMLGNHGLWAKRLYYEYSANVPMILVGAKAGERVAAGATDDRLVGLQDVMPTLLGLAGIECPDGCDGQPMLTGENREHLYAECNEGEMAARMIHDGRHKLLYFAAGNRKQLFDLVDDPHELKDLSESPEHADTLERLTETLVGELYGDDREWLDGEELVGLPQGALPETAANRGLALQRGTHWPPAPVTPPQVGETNSGTN